MPQFLIRKITRRNPFAIERVPLLAKIYRHPFDKYSSPARQFLFGAPNLLMFFLYQRLVPIKPKGTFRFRIGGKDKQIVFDARNTQFSALYFSWFAQGYEPQVTALLDVLMPNNGVFLDVGSNWGWFSLFLSSQPDFQGQIHAFEPFHSTYADLVSTVEQAGLRDVIHCHEVALSDTNGEAAMHLPDHFQSGTAVMADPKTRQSRKNVQMVTLDSLKLHAASVIKIDAEGSETKVLRGGSQLIARHRPMIVFESGRRHQDPESTLQPMRFLRDLGYTFFHLGWLRHAAGEPYFMGDDSDVNPQSEEILSLARFEVNERFLHQDSMNIFACHEDRLRELVQQFEPYQFSPKLQT